MPFAALSMAPVVFGGCGWSVFCWALGSAVDGVCVWALAAVAAIAENAPAKMSFETVFILSSRNE
jgi:hypothetical protein